MGSLIDSILLIRFDFFTFHRTIGDILTLSYSLQSLKRSFRDSIRYKFGLQIENENFFCWNSVSLKTCLLSRLLNKIFAISLTHRSPQKLNSIWEVVTLKCNSVYQNIREILSSVWGPVTLKCKFVYQNIQSSLWEVRTLKYNSVYRNIREKK